MTGFEKIFEVVKKLDKEQFDVTTINKYSDGGMYIEVRWTRGEREINFEFDRNGDLVDIF